jgi:GNAT superfamily N-acetyltransferase
MRFRADWLREVLTVPYVPILGPVHPDVMDPAMFDEVIAASRTGAVLPFDKDSRWTSTKPDTVLVDEIVHRPDHTIVPVLSRRGAGVVKTYFYGTAADHQALREFTRRCCTAHGAAAGRIIWFDTDPRSASTRVLLKDLGADPVPVHRNPAVRELGSLQPAQAATFTDFATALAEHGFGFLHRRREAGQVNGPILVAVHDARVVGAIGPLNTLADRHGTTMLLPQYFGVLPDQHGRGHGRALWRAAAAWGARHGAAYQLLQTAVGQASENLFLSEGLGSLGFACTVAV